MEPTLTYKILIILSVCLLVIKVTKVNNGGLEKLLNILVNYSIVFLVFSAYYFVFATHSQLRFFSDLRNTILPYESYESYYLISLVAFAIMLRFLSKDGMKRYLLDRYKTLQYISNQLVVVFTVFINIALFPFGDNIANESVQMAISDNPTTNRSVSLEQDESKATNRDERRVRYSRESRFPVTGSGITNAKLSEFEAVMGEPTLRTVSKMIIYDFLELNQLVEEGKLNSRFSKMSRKEAFMDLKLLRLISDKSSISKGFIENTLTNYSSGRNFVGVEASYDQFIEDEYGIKPSVINNEISRVQKLHTGELVVQTILNITADIFGISQGSEQIISDVISKTVLQHDLRQENIHMLAIGLDYIQPNTLPVSEKAAERIAFEVRLERQRLERQKQQQRREHAKRRRGRK